MFSLEFGLYILFSMGYFKLQKIWQIMEKQLHVWIKFGLVRLKGSLLKAWLKAKQSKVVKKRVKAEASIPIKWIWNNETKIDNIRTVNETPIPCSG